MKKSLLILLFTCWALFFAAFRPVMPFAAETAAFPDGTPVTGGRILMGTIGEPSNLIPYMASDSASGEITGLLYVAPLKYDKDLNVVPWAAASYEVLEGGRLLRFVLRDDIRWEDGVPLTADDVEFTYKLMIDPKTPTAYSGDFLAIESFKKTGRLSFEVRYAKPFARSLMTWMGAILPKHVLEGQDIMTTPVARKPIGAGPYRLAKWDAGSMLTLTASDTYFEGRPNLDEVVYRIIPDPSTMFLELKAGKLDMMSLSPQQYLRQTQGPQWERDWRKYRYLSFSYTFLGFNLEHPFFKDVRVRRAISMAIDRQSLIDGVLLGQGVPTVGPYKPGTWAYNDKLTPVRQDVDEARRLLDEAGWKKNKDGLLERDGKPFLFTILVNQGNDSRIKAAIIIQSQLKALGITVHIRTVEWAAFIKEFVNKGHFDAIILAWTITLDPDIYDVWHSSRAKPGGLNFTGYRNAEVDELLVEARSMTDQDRRKELYDRVQEILEKYENVKKVNWHMIGHLQTNKVKYIIDKVCMIHSVDSLHLAEEIDRRAAQHGLTMDILVEVNAAGDEAKFGVDVKSAEKLVNDILESCPHVRVRGLMTIAPYAEDPEEVRPYFREMKQLYDRLAIIKHDHLDFKYLSMGMSNDRVIAVEEGSTVIRVGTAIFGARTYNV